MMQETEEEDVELVGGGRRGPSSLGISSDSKGLKRGLLSFAGIIIALNIIVFTLGVKYSQEYTPPPTPEPVDNESKPASFRLSPLVRPLHYIMQVDPDMNAFTFTVRENIMIEITNSSTRDIILHARELQVSDVLLHTQNGTTIAPSSVSYYTPDEFVIFHFGKNLTNLLVDQTLFNITFVCSGQIGDIARGFYRSSYMENEEKKWLAVTDFEPADARSAFVCFDEPSFKATFTMSVSADASEGWFAISNMNEVSITPRHYSTNGSADGYQVHHFATSPLMSTYLVCYVVSRFGHVTYNGGSVPVRVFAPPLVVEQGRFAAETGSKIVDAFGDYFDIPYVMPKLDMIALPDFTSGAMENWGLITYRIEALLWNPNTSSLASKQSIAMIISHELAHQWFGNLVTMGWWDNVWLNEGFASFVEYQGVDLVYPSWNIWSQFIPMDRSVAMDLDSLHSSHPLVVPILSADVITQQFDSISYSKGASVLRMLRDKMEKQSQGSFVKGIHHYLTKREYGNAESTQLWADIVEETGQTDVTGFMKSWTEQVGYPVVNASLGDDGKIHLSQRRFLYTSSPTNETQLWNVPLTIQKRDDFVSQAYDEEHTEIIDDGSWAVLNVNGSGYYRVSYDQALLDRIIAQWEEDHLVFSDETRSSLLSDSFALNLAQSVPIEYPLSLVKNMKGERDYVPWWTTLGSLGGLRPFVDEQRFYETFQRFISATLRDTVDHLTFTESEDSDESHSTRLLRPVALTSAISAGDERTINEGYRLFEAKKQGRPTNTSSALNPAIYAAAASKSNEMDYKWMKDAYLKETSATEKNVLLAALCKFGRHEHVGQIQSTLQDALNPDIIKPKDMQSTLVNIARSSRDGRTKTWEFIERNFDLLKAKFGDAPFVMDGIIKRVTSLFSTSEDKKRISDFLNNSGFSKGSRSIIQALEQIDINRKWREKNVESLEKWLDQWAESHPEK
ncbi:puromycin-sensitive aminopeptidase-like [Planoprotostelium fungivorum]|uniref:Aminopeptidase n=1 Tax=Planoprotostelium fungivorum TaxID=1890364 RepID=A0A2P6NP65_9EUKA|nr:puromycin-sensitive aminopeptidase-like [Planoprotostelium fungivorum]